MRMENVSIKDEIKEEPVEFQESFSEPEDSSYNNEFCGFSSLLSERKDCCLKDELFDVEEEQIQGSIHAQDLFVQDFELKQEQRTSSVTPPLPLPLIHSHSAFLDSKWIKEEFIPEAHSRKIHKLLPTSRCNFDLNQNYVKRSKASKEKTGLQSTTEQSLLNDIKNSKYPIVKLKKLNVTNSFVKDKSFNKNIFRIKRNVVDNTSSVLIENGLVSNSKEKKGHKCSECDFVTMFRENVGRHASTHITNLKFKCSQCPFVTTSQRYLKDHKLTHLENKLYKCRICGHESNSKRNFKVHVLNHTDDRLFHCSACAYSTNDKRSLRQHQIIRHKKTFGEGQVKRNNSSQISFKCSECNFKTEYEKEHKIHELNHFQLKLFYCSICEYNTNVKSNLRRHMLIHQDTKRFQCSHCQYQTNERGHLRRHFGIHERQVRMVFAKYRT